mgnify:CR=1 FL=1
MSVSYYLALRGLGTDEDYIESIGQFLNSRTETQQSRGKDIYSIGTHVLTMFFHYDKERTEYINEAYGFKADVRFSVYPFSAHYEKGIDLLLELVIYMDFLGVDYLLAEDGEIFRKENGKLTISPKRKNYDSYLNEETIRRFLG